MYEKITWDEFRENGFLVLVNWILHIFGLAIVVMYDDDKVVDVFPAKVKYRGFNRESNDKAYKRLNKYMVDHAEEIYNDGWENDEDEDN